MLERNKQCSNYKDYAILLGNITMSKQFVNAICSINNKTVRWSDYNKLNLYLQSINTLITQEHQEHKKKKTKPTYIIYVNSAIKDILPPYENIEYQPIDRILPVYSSFIHSFEIKELEVILNKIKPYIDTMVDLIGTTKYKSIRKEYEVGFGFIARRILEKIKPDLVCAKTAYITKNNAPPPDIIKDYITPLKQYNVNKIVCKDIKNIIAYNVLKVDRDASFWSNVYLHDTIISLEKLYAKNNKRQNKVIYRDIVNYYMQTDKTFLAKIYFKKPPVCKGNVDWLRLCNIDTTSVITVSHVTWLDIVENYNITSKDIEVVEYYKAYTHPFPEHIRKLIQYMHEIKSRNKTEHNDILNLIIKQIIHVLHGFGYCRAFTEEGNMQYYCDTFRSDNKCRQMPGNVLLNPYDADMFYEWTRHELLTMINMCDNIYNYDTDSVTTTQQEGFKLIENYNNNLKQQYINRNLNPDDYTHYGHLIGQLEIEAKCKAFYLMAPKFYIYEEDDKLKSTTTGYTKNIIANSIMQDAPTSNAVKALEWFYNTDYVIPNLGYQYNGSFMSKVTFDKNRLLKNSQDLLSTLYLNI